MTQLPKLPTFAARLKWARDERKLSQKALGKKAGVSQGAIGNYETGARDDPRDLISLAQALDVPAEWLAHGTVPRNKEPQGHSTNGTHHVAQPPAPPIYVVSMSAIDQALPVVLDAFAGLSVTRWASVRAQLELLHGHPEMRDDVLHEVAALLQESGKRHAAG